MARELAVPQAIRRSLGSIITFIMAYRWTINDAVIQFPPPSIVGPDAEVTDLTVFIIGCFYFISAWFAYGVYRTILAARREPKVKDIL